MDSSGSVAQRRPRRSWRRCAISRKHGRLFLRRPLSGQQPIRCLIASTCDLDRQTLSHRMPSRSRSAPLLAAPNAELHCAIDIHGFKLAVRWRKRDVVINDDWCSHGDEAREGRRSGRRAGRRKVTAHCLAPSSEILDTHGDLKRVIRGDAAGFKRVEKRVSFL